VNLNDVWSFNAKLNQWQWMFGSDPTQQPLSGFITPRAYFSAVFMSELSLVLVNSGVTGSSNSILNMEVLHDVYRIDISSGSATSLSPDAQSGVAFSAAEYTDQSSSAKGMVFFGGLSNTSNIFDSEVVVSRNFSNIVLHFAVPGGWRVLSNSFIDMTGLFGAKGKFDIATRPSSRIAAASTYLSANDYLFIFGGYGYDSTGRKGDLIIH
jgi:hypothetical protein